VTEDVVAPEPSLRDASSYLAAGVAAGFLSGLVIGGIGGRLAMLLLRLTSDPALHGTISDDGFTIGRVSTETLFLLAATAMLGVLGGVVYLFVRSWVPPRIRPWGSAALFGVVGATFALRPGGVDFTLLEPAVLAVAMFVVLPAVFGFVLSRLTERLLRSSRFRGSWVFLAALLPLVPLALFSGVGAFIAIAAVAAWVAARSAPGLVTLWTSTAAIWIGRALLIGATAWFLTRAATEGAEILL